MKYLQKFNENVENWFDDSLIENIESILIELKDNYIPINIRIMPAHNKRSYKYIVIDFKEDFYSLDSFPREKFQQEDGKIMDYINESFKTLIDYINELGFFTSLYISTKTGGESMNINYIINAGAREFSYLRSFKIIISKTKMYK